MKRLILLLSLPLLLILGAALLAPNLAPEGRLRAEAIAALVAATGEEPRIAGDVEFVVLPWPSIRVNGLEFGAPQGSADGIFLKVPEARIVLDLLPLLTGRAKLERIVLGDPRLVLPNDSWPSDEAMAALAKRLSELSASVAVSVDDGAVLVRKAGSPEVVLRAVDGDLNLRGGRGVAVEGGAEWRGERIEFEGSLVDLVALATGGAARARLSLSGAPVSMGFSGTAKLAGSPVVEGDVRLAAPKLRNLIGWLGGTTPTEEGFGALDLRARALLSPGSAALSDARIELDGNRSDGGFTVRRDVGRLVMQGSFASSLIDLSPYGRLVLSGPDGEWSRLPIDVARLGSLDLDLRLSAGEVRTGETTFEAVAASALLKGGRLALTVGEAQAWNGVFQAAINMAPPASGAGVDVRVELEGTDVDLESSLADLFHLQRLAGTGTFHVALAGTGGNVAGIVQNLGGTVALNAAPGALLGIDVERVLSRLERNPLSSGGTLRGGRTPFETLEVNANVAQGTAHIEELSVVSPSVHIAMSGDVSVPRRDLDLKGTASLVAAAGTQAAGSELPFVVQGAWDSPFVLPDPQALIRRSGAARPLLGASPAAVGVSSPAP